LPQRQRLIDVEYTGFVRRGSAAGLGTLRLRYAAYQQVIDAAPREVLDRSHINLAELDYAIVEALRLLEFVRAIQSRAPPGREVVVVANLSYGGFVLDIIEEDLAAAGIKTIRTKIGSTESHNNPWVFRADLFSNEDLTYLITHQPTLVVIDGTQHLVDREGGDGQLGRYPDAYQGYRNFALAFNLALAKVRGTVLDTDSPALLGKDETFVSTFSPQFHDFIERLTGLMTDLPPAQLERLQPYPMTYWNPDGLRGDFFMESADTHSVFYFTFGWLSLWLAWG